MRLLRAASASLCKDAFCDTGAKSPRKNFTTELHDAETLAPVGVTLLARHTSRSSLNVVLVLFRAGANPWNTSLGMPCHVFRKEWKGRPCWVIFGLKDVCADGKHSLATGQPLCTKFATPGDWRVYVKEWTVSQALEMRTELPVMICIQHL